MLCHQNNQEKTIHRYPYILHGQIIAGETNTKYLWVTIGDNMTWNTHIEQIAAKGNIKVGFLKRNLKINIIIIIIIIIIPAAFT